MSKFKKEAIKAIEKNDHYIIIVKDKKTGDNGYFYNGHCNWIIFALEQLKLSILAEDPDMGIYIKKGLTTTEESVIYR